MTRKIEPKLMLGTPRVEGAFKALKIALTNSLVLRNLDFDFLFLFQIAISKTSLGAILFQDFEGEEHPIMYIIHKVTPTEQR